MSETLRVASACSLPFSVSAAATIAVGSLFAPATMSAVWPSREIETPGRGGTTVEMRESERRIASAFATVARKAGEFAVRVDEWTTTIGAELERPPKFCWISVRACTDCDPFACQPAPGERRLHLRREHRECDRDHRPGDRDDADVVGGEAAEPADRADRLRMLDRGGDSGGRFSD